MNLHEWTANHQEEFGDLTEHELIAIYNSIKEEEGELHDIKLKIEFILHKIAMAELLEDRCKSGKHAGEELRKKLIEDTGLPGAQPVNSKCLSEEDAKLKEYFKRQKEAENEYVVKALEEGAKK